MNKQNTRPDYHCGVLNCGNGTCVHETTQIPCPACKEHMLIFVRPTTAMFCPGSGGSCYGCDYEAWASLAPPARHFSHTQKEQ
ncbi:MAG: hypothetical protein OEW37_10665 [Rhodospirillaceae bacterium]|nr:hypothetical protein [Rhodospirillaceae bacterium]